MSPQSNSPVVLPMRSWRARVAVAGSLFFVGLLIWSYQSPATDHWMIQVVSAHRQPDLNQIALWLTQLGKFDVLMPVGVIICLVLLRFDRRCAAFAAVAMAGSAALTQVFKFLIARPRPGEPWALVEIGSYSFPSGHSASTMALALTMAFVLYRLAPRWLKSTPGIVVLGLLFGFAVVVSCTRVYLGVHYPSDVLAGWALAAVWVVIVDHRCFRNTGRPDRKDTE